MDLLDDKAPTIGFHEDLWRALSETSFFNDINLEQHPIRRMPPLRAGHLPPKPDGLEVAAVKIKGDQATITFKQSSEIVDVPEERLGVRLFHRTTRSVSLTDAINTLSPRLGI